MRRFNRWLVFLRKFSINIHPVILNMFRIKITALEQINRQLKHCHMTTGRMMRLRSDDSHLSKSCQVNVVINEVVALLSQQLKLAKVKAVLRLSDSLPMVHVGQVECHQVVHNVLVNAIQAMPAGGKIKIRTSLDKTKNMVIIDVEDEGIGITPEHLSKVFEPFFSTKERGIEKNTGLGLSIVYSIVHSLGGDIHIQSSLRKGTAVRIDLPLAAIQS